MQISLKHGFVFLCTPKCASNAIEDMLRQYVDMDLQGSPRIRHTTVREYDRYLRPYLVALEPDRPIETIAVIREPLSWLYSWYRFRARSTLRVQRHANSTSHVSFSEFIEAYLTNPQPEFARVGSQADWLLGDSDELGIDRLFPYESLPRLVSYFSDRIEKPLSLRRLNVSPRRIYKSDLFEMVSAVRRHIWARNLRDCAQDSTCLPDPQFALPPRVTAELRVRLRRDIELHSQALGKV